MVLFGIRGRPNWRSICLGWLIQLLTQIFDPSNVAQSSDLCRKRHAARRFKHDPRRVRLWRLRCCSKHQRDMANGHAFHHVPQLQSRLLSLFTKRCSDQNIGENIPVSATRMLIRSQYHRIRHQLPIQICSGSTCTAQPRFCRRTILCNVARCRETDRPWFRKVCYRGFNRVSFSAK